MKLFRLFLPALLVVVFAANPVRAQGTISWNSGYPQTGSNTGDIDVSGTITLDCGWSLSGFLPKVTVKAWQDGMVESSTTVTIVSLCSGYQWNGTISGLSSGYSYNLTVEVSVVKGCDNETLATVLATQTAK